LQLAIHAPVNAALSQAPSPLLIYCARSLALLSSVHFSFAHPSHRFSFQPLFSSSAVMTEVKATNITAVEHNVTRSKRAEFLGVNSKFSGCTVWFTGKKKSKEAT
jgi:hypothetical protein